MTYYRYIGKGITDDKGVAHLKEDAEGQSVEGYVGKGKGLTQFIASTDKPTDISESSLQSETFVTLDCIVYDDGVSDPKKTSFIKSGNGTVTIGSNGTTVSATSNTTYRNTTLITGDFEIILQATLVSSVRIGVQTSADLGYKQTKFNYFDVTDTYFKLRRVGSTFTAQYSSDGVNWTNRSLETNNVGDNDCYFLILLETTGTERTITYKDLKIYPI